MYSNIAAICFSHMTWVGDSLAIYFAHMKNDQEGARPKDPRHIYANPINPEACNILSLGLYFLCFGFASDARKLFPGQNQYDRYSKKLKNLLSRPEVAAELKARGIDPNMIGTHSTRKGAASYCASGSTAGPSLVAISLRTGWILEGVTNRYIRYEGAGDQFVGRTVSSRQQECRQQLRF
jgi:hypothetical protein